MLNSKNVHTPQSSHFLFPSKKIHNGLYVSLTKIENTYYGASKVGPMHAKEAYEDMEAQPHSFLTQAVRWKQGISLSPGRISPPPRPLRESD